MGEKVLEIKGVSKNALKAVSIEVERGGFLVVVAPSGSGKTTLLNLVCGIEPLESGQIYVDGEAITEIEDLDRWRAASIGYVLQENNLIPTLTVYENVELPLDAAKFPKEKRRERVLNALDSVGLRDKARLYSSKLSMEEEQRVALARAIVSEPDLILADEPTGRLRKGEKESLIRLMADLNKENGYTFIVATHDHSIRSVASKVLELPQ